MAAAEEPRHVGYRTLLTLAALVVVVAGLRASHEFIVPFLLACFLSILCAPSVLWLERKRVPAWIAVALVMIGAIGLVTAFGGLLITAVSDFNDALPRYRERFERSSDQLHVFLERIDVDVSLSQIYGVLEPRSLIDLVGTALGGLVAALLDTSLVLLMMIFILLEAAGFPKKMRAAMQDPNADLGRWVAVMGEVQRYLVIKTVISLITGALVAAWVAVLGVDFPLLWGLVAFLLHYIPNVGAILAAIPAVLVATVQLGFGHGLLVASGYLVIGMTMGNIAEPQLMGRKLGLSPLVVFVSLVFWGWVWGPAGMLLSVPLTMVVKIMLEMSDDSRWVAVLLDSAPPVEPGKHPATSAVWSRLTGRQLLDPAALSGVSSSDPSATHPSGRDPPR